MGQTPLLQDLKKARHLVQDEFWNNNALGLSLYIRKFARKQHTSVSQKARIYLQPI